MEKSSAPWQVGLLIEHRCLVIAVSSGLCGPQGSGKSTAVKFLQVLLAERGVRAAILSLDDVYLPRSERLALAARIHPLLAVRGPPGTHELPLAEAVIGQLLSGGSPRSPTFDKATDDRVSMDGWPVSTGPADVVLLEGWCVGAVMQERAALATPMNELERLHHRDGSWRIFVNSELGAYQSLFGKIDVLIQFRPPDFDIVAKWRYEQEAKLRFKAPRNSSNRIMTEAEVRGFVQHFERLTRHIIGEMPDRADVLIDLGTDREFRSIRWRHDRLRGPVRP